MTDELVALLDKSKKERQSYKYMTMQTLSGFFLGKSQETYGEYAKAASDLFCVSDIRDLVNAGYDYYEGKEIDEFTVALATINLALVALPVARFAKRGLSILQSAAHAKVISPRMQSEVLALAKNREKLGGFVKIMSCLIEFSNKYGIQPTIEVLRNCKSLFDIPRITHLVATFGKNAGKILKFGGKDVIKIAEKQGVKTVECAIPYGEKAVSALSKYPGRILTKDVPLFRRLLKTSGKMIFDFVHLMTNLAFAGSMLVLAVLPFLFNFIYKISRKQTDTAENTLINN